ncbi:hypothetical protein D3C85_1285760 [compost metagenome]
MKRFDVLVFFNGDVAANILQFFLQRKKLIRIPQYASHQLNQRFRYLNNIGYPIQLGQVLNSIQCIIQKMRTNLRLQHSQLRFTLLFLGRHNPFKETLQFFHHAFKNLIELEDFILRLNFNGWEC